MQYCRICSGRDGPIELIQWAHHTRNHRFVGDNRNRRRQQKSDVHPAAAATTSGHQRLRFGNIPLSYIIILNN